MSNSRKIVAWVLLRRDDDGLEPIMFYGGAEKPSGEFKERFELRPVCFADEPAAKPPKATTDSRIAYAVGANNGKWPKELFGGVMFYDGLRITKAQFVKFAKNGPPA